MTVRVSPASSIAGLFIASSLFLPLLINPVVAQVSEEIYLWPKLWWIGLVILPSAVGVLAAVRGWWRTPLAGLAGAYLGVELLALLFHADRWASLTGHPNRLDGLLTRLALVVCALAAYQLARHLPRVPRWAGSLALAFVGLAAVLVALQHLGIIGSFGEGLEGVSSALPGATLGNRGFAGGYLALVLPITLAVAARERRWWLYLLVAVTAFALGGTATRAAWIAGLAGVGAWTVVQPRKLKWRLAVLAVVMGVLGGAPFLQPIDTRTLTADNVASDSGRVILWKAALRAVRASPLVGNGPETFQRWLREGDPAEFARAHGIATPPGLVVKWVSKPGEIPVVASVLIDGKRYLAREGNHKVHNEFLDQAASFGVPAALLYAALMLGAVWRSRNNPALLGAVLAYIAYLCLWPEVMRFAPVAWAVLGAAWAVPDVRKFIP